MIRLQTEVEREAPDRLSCRRWRFQAVDEDQRGVLIRLDSYTEFARPTTRHKYQPVRLFEPGTPPRRAYAFNANMPAADVVLPADVVAEASANLSRLHFLPPGVTR